MASWDITTTFHLVWDKEFEITNGSLHLITLIKMTKDLKNQDAINDDNSITFHMAYNKINHSATPINVNDTVNKSYVDTQTNILFQTD